MGPGGEQTMMVMGEGRAPGLEHLRALARKHDLRHGEVVLEEVRSAVADWSKHADAAGLAKKAAKLIGDRIAPAPPKKAAAPKKGAKKTTSAKGKASAKPKAASKKAQKPRSSRGTRTK